MSGAAIAVLGTLAVIVGAALYLPFFLSFRRQRALRGGPRGLLGRRVTAPGLAFTIALVRAMLAGVAMASSRPERWLAVFAYESVVLALASFAERGRERRGVVLLRPAAARE